MRKLVVKRNNMSLNIQQMKVDSSNSCLLSNPVFIWHKISKRSYCSCLFIYLKFCRRTLRKNVEFKVFLRSTCKFEDFEGSA